MAEEKKYRKRTFLEIQPYLFAYGAAISAFSPLSLIYQLSKLNPQVPMTTARMIKYSAIVFPAQTLLKTIQMDIGTPVKEYLNPWAAFAVIGVLQGGVYGQANIYFSKEMKIATTTKLTGMFRGVLFAGTRDILSQGVPFMLSPYMRKYVFDPLFPTKADSSPVLEDFKYWGSVLTTSVFATIASQGCQNGQITMQSDQSLSYARAIKKLWNENGVKMFYRGAEARIGFLLIVTVLNQLLLKPAWAPVEIDE